MMIDTHTHLFLEQFDEDIEEVIERASKVGVEKFFLPHIDSETSAKAIELCEKYPNQCYLMMGLHPCSVKEAYKEELKNCEKLMAKHKIYAIGETGLDYYWDTTFKTQQKESLQLQIDWAKNLKLPIVLHCRDSMDDVIEMIAKNNDENLTGIFHCFSGTVKQAQQIIDMDFYLGIGGVVTFKNGGLDKILPAIGIEKLVLETDSPYLAPAPHRGKRNESSYVDVIADKVADVLQISKKEVVKQTTKNANKIFKI